MQRTEGWRTVRLLSLTSLLADVSGEMLIPVLPFLLLQQGAGVLGAGLVGAASEAVGHLSKWVGGRMGDRSRHPRLQVAFGYVGAAAARFGVALATAWPVSLLWRSVDRIGKGFRTAPRDAMLSAAVPARERGRAFAFHRAADTAGAVLGVLGAIGLYFWGGLGPRSIILVAAFVGLVAAIPLVFVREPSVAPTDGRSDPRPARGFRGYLVVSCLLAAGQLNTSFFLLRAAGTDLDLSKPDARVLLALVGYLAFNVVYAAASYPFGVLADRWGKARVLGAGLALGAAASLLFAPAPGLLVSLAGFVVLGLSLAATEATGRAIAADLAGSKTSTHLGVYHAAVGAATLAGALAGGLVWVAWGPAALFLLAAATCLAAGAALALWRRQERLWAGGASPT